MIDNKMKDYTVMNMVYIILNSIISSYFFEITYQNLRIVRNDVIMRKYRVSQNKVPSFDHS